MNGSTGTGNWHRRLAKQKICCSFGIGSAKCAGCRQEQRKAIAGLIDQGCMLLSDPHGVAD